MSQPVGPAPVPLRQPPDSSLAAACVLGFLCGLRSSRLLHPKALHEDLKLYFSITPKSQMEKGIIGVETAPKLQ